MLDSKSLKLLKWLNKQYKNGNRSFSSFEVLYNSFKKYAPLDVESALETLEDYELIESIHADLTSINIKLTYAGRTYLELRRKEIINDVIKSILTPIIISIITTLVTLWIKSILKL